jgi:hypothetical protein
MALSMSCRHSVWCAATDISQRQGSGIMQAAVPTVPSAAGGRLPDIETTVAMTAKEAQATFEAAGKAAKNFRSAGRR